MSFEVDPPVSLTARIYAMRVNSDRFFAKAKRHTIKAIASRLGLQNGRVYKTAQEKGGIRVWRLEDRATVQQPKENP